MNKIKYYINIKNSIFEFNIKSDSADVSDEKIIRYAKMAMNNKRSVNLTIDEIFSEFNHKCPFCDRKSAYSIIYTIDRILKNIIIDGLELITNKDKMPSYHCRSGRNSGCPGSLLNPNSIEYVSGSYCISLDDANSYILSRNKSPFYINNFNSTDAYKKAQSRNIDWYIKKYGDDEGKNRYVSFCNLKKLQTSNEYLISKFGEAGYKDICSRKGSSLSSFINKYGEELGPIKHAEYLASVGLNREAFINKWGGSKWIEQRKSIERKKSLEHMIETLGPIDGRKKYDTLIKSYSFTREDYIRKYGIEKWLERMSKPIKRYSKEAIQFFKLLLLKFDEAGICYDSLMFGNAEFFLWDSDYKRIYFYDFHINIIDGPKIIIEYDNTFWHPETSDDVYAGDIFKNMLTSEQKKEYDNRKNMFARYKGFFVINCVSRLNNPLRDQWKYNTLINETLEKIKNGKIE